MLVNVGSTNPVKVESVRNVLSLYDYFDEASFMEVDVKSGVSEQPSGKKEIYLGARNRARRAFETAKGCNYGVGLESGLDNISGDDVFAMNRTVCAVYNGKRTSFGEGSTFPIPRNVAELIWKKHISLDEALFKLGIVKEKRVGYGKGFVSILTDDRISREDLLKQAVHMALIPIIRKDLFWKR